MRALRSAAVSAVIALVLYLTLMSGIDARAVGRAMTRLGWLWWAAILALSLINYGLRFGRWHYYVRSLGHVVPIERNLTIYIAGFALTATPGKAGEALRSVYLRPFGIGYGHSLAALFTERFSDLMAMLLLSALGLLTFSRYTGGIVAALAVVAGALAVIQRPGLAGTLERIARRRHNRWFSALLHRLATPLAASSSLLRVRPLCLGLFLGLLGWGAEGVALYYIAQSLGIELSPTLAVAIYAISILVGAISFLPGGLGSTEAAMGFLLTLSGATSTTAIACTLITRAATLWFAVLLGVIALATLELTDRQRAPRADQP